MADWAFLTNHAQVLLAIARAPEARVRDIAARVGITERATHGILRDLEAEGYISRTRVGRRTVYTVHGDRPFRHPLARHREVGALLDLLTDEAAPPIAG